MRDEYYRAPRGFPLVHRLMPLYRRSVGRVVHRLFYLDLLEKTRNFDDLTWAGHPIWQNVLDLWTIQETIWELQPSLIVETGTNRGGAAMFYAHLLDQLGDGEVITIDVSRLHQIDHPRVTFLHGSSVDPGIVGDVRTRVMLAHGHVMVILDADHSADHVRRELSLYSEFVTPDSFILVQDGIIDLLPTTRKERPGPLPAIHDFLASHPEFVVDTAREERFLVTHHPSGWLRRVQAAQTKPTDSSSES